MNLALKEICLKKSNKIEVLQSMLQSAASRANKEWFEAYLKHVIRYRGLKTPQVVTIVKLWRSNERIGELSLQEQFELAAQLIGAEYAEDKFSGIFYMEKYLVGKIAFKDFFSCAEDLFSKNAFTNWATTDWFNVRVLSPLITLHGKDAVEHFTSWTNCDDIWQRRSSILCLRACVKSPNYLKHISRVIAKLSPDPERFIQTAIGWLLSDLSRSYPKVAEKIIEDNFEYISSEAIRRHTKYLPMHKKYVARKKLG